MVVQYISGAAAEYNPDGKDAYEKFISKLSGRLIYEGYKIVSGYGLGVGSAVISGALSEIYYNQKKSLTDQLILRPFLTLSMGHPNQRNWCNNG